MVFIENMRAHMHACTHTRVTPLPLVHTHSIVNHINSRTSTLTPTIGTNTLNVCADTDCFISVYAHTLTPSLESAQLLAQSPEQRVSVSLLRESIPPDLAIAVRTDFGVT